MQSDSNARPSELSKSICIFDFDGTLVDSMGSFASIAATLIENFYSMPYEEAHQCYRQTSGLPFNQQLELIFPQHPQNVETANLFEQRKQENYFNSPCYPEIPHVLAELKAWNIKLIISSNNHQELVEAYLSQHPHLSSLFDLTLGYRPNFSKGSDHFHKILEHYQTTRENMLFVGDSLQDAQKSIDFGIDFVGRRGTFTEQEFLNAFPQIKTVENLQELKKILCK